MALINFGYRVNMSELTPPTESGAYIVAYDTDGFLKQLDHLGNLTKIGASVAGPEGPPGPVGPAGLTWSGPWMATQSYSLNYAVGYGSASWWCVSPITGSPSNPGPDVDTEHWTLLAAQGSPGAQGPQGEYGNDGAQGPIGLNWIGDWIMNVYDPRDAVYYNGSSYVCIASTVGTETLSPDSNPTCWKLLASKGDSGPQGPTGSQDAFTFSSNLLVSLTNNKSFGRYTTGQSIPSKGKTVYEVLQMAIVESIPPGVTLSISTPSIAFNQTAISNVLTYTYSINSLGANVSTTLLEWRRNNSGAWINLSSSTQSFSFTHTLGDSSFATQSFNYRYTVTDSQGASASAIKSITPTAYQAPNATLLVTAPTKSTPETNLMRELGNYVSSLDGTITRNSPLVDLVSYDLQYRKNSGTWTTFTSSVCGPTSATIPSITHNEPTLSDSTSISYRVLVTDSYTQSSLATSTINFYKLIFYGPTSSTPGNSLQVRSLPNRIFSSGPSSSNPFTFFTGLTATVFSVAVPSPSTIAVFDLDTSSTLSDYILSSVLVDDFYGKTSSYNVYTETTGVPYTNHEHRVTI
jgi:hypothetical protein